MPFSPGDALSYKKLLSSNEARERWSRIANAILAETGDEGKAIRIANGKSKGSSPINRDSITRRMNRQGHPRG